MILQLKKSIYPRLENLVGNFCVEQFPLSVQAMKTKNTQTTIHQSIPTVAVPIIYKLKNNRCNTADFATAIAKSCVVSQIRCL